MHIHILGICGTFMGSLAVLAKQMGYRVTGSDANVYPPMSTQLEQQGIAITRGYDAAQLDAFSSAPDVFIIGNAMSRGNPCVEAILNRQLPFTSGPQWLREHVLQNRHVIALSGTHGKTTTSSMVAHVLRQSGLDTGYLIGGVPQGFGASAHLGTADFFVVEADEYDSAFFDKRSKFIHYMPRTLVINNLEFDHADIFDSLADIQKQFHYLVRTLATQAAVIYPNDVPTIAEIIHKECYAEPQTLAIADTVDAPITSLWHTVLESDDGSAFGVYYQQDYIGSVRWALTGRHNVANGLSAISACTHALLSAQSSTQTNTQVRELIAPLIEALSNFHGVKRRLENLGTVRGVTVYDDFAHHPTAIASTLQGMRAKLGAEAKITAVIEPRSNTMKMGAHHKTLQDSAASASQVFWSQPENIDWQLADTISENTQHHIVHGIDALVQTVAEQAETGEHIIIMSNGGFGGFHQKLLLALQS